MRYIFTATAGRSGQASLTDLLNRHVPGCLAYFEEPQVHPRLPSVLGDLERRFRRRFVETHELLGRGRVLEAFSAGDEAALDRMAARRLSWIEAEARRHAAEVYVDVSKYFVRGLHRAICRAVPDLGVVRLVRDPILNMRSFLNRGKDFYLDNNRPDCSANQFRLDADRLESGELYLWAWCEVYLRFDALVSEFGLSPAVEIRTDDLNDPARMAQHLSALGLAHSAIEVAAPRNTNRSLGLGGTAVTRDDIALFERFRDRIPAAVRARIAYLDDYDPGALHETGRAA